jgi:predicted DNA-binding transcriptional regulator AlpA
MTEQVTKQIVMDYDDFSQVLADMADKIAAKLKAEAPAQGSADSELLTAKEVRAIIGVTDKTLHVWDKTGFLPRVRIGGVVRYRRADVERVAQVKGR